LLDDGRDVAMALEPMFLCPKAAVAPRPEVLLTSDQDSVSMLILASAAAAVPLPVAALLVGCFLFCVAVFGWVILTYGKSRRALSGLASSMGLVEVAPRRCALGRHDHGTLSQPSRAAAGQRDGVRVELMFSPKQGRSGPNVTVVGVVAATPPGFGVQLHRSRAWTLPVGNAWIPFSGPLAATHRAAGHPLHIETLLTSPLQSRILAFPRELEELGVYDGAATLVWRRFETDRSVIEEAFRLGLACLQAANTTAAGNVPPR
jgi:hypothetical protein